MTPAELASERERWRTLADDVRAHIAKMDERGDTIGALVCVQNLGLAFAGRHIDNLRRVMGVDEPMTKERFREIMQQLGWSQGDVARALDRDPREVRRWAAGQNAIDHRVAAWLEVQAANPPPRRARRPIDGFSRS